MIRAFQEDGVLTEPNTDHPPSGRGVVAGRLHESSFCGVFGCENLIGKC